MIHRSLWTEQYTYLSKSYHHPWYAAIKGVESRFVERVPEILCFEAT